VARAKLNSFGSRSGDAIWEFRNDRWTLEENGRELGRHKGTISRELQRNKGGLKRAGSETRLIVIS
jgi:IS30 family transposase